ncbi:hypothetical protein [Streptomyces sp. NBC_01477]|uniref:hypothetical protein n=1 Tax=Streptomyces sp. NBC_01477 TaxID=2976015 RepID=UPI002E3601C5|nr:hypothetical protein [Streptomyces sp. NBC_01477]
MTNMTSSVLTSAGLAVGIGVLIVEHVRWWRSGGAAAPAGGGKKGAPVAAAGKSRDPMVLGQIWAGMAFGTLMVACPAGMLGTAAGFIRWGGNGIGGTLMHAMTGAQPSTVADAAAPQLDDKGAIVVTALVVVLFLLRKTYAKQIRGRFLRGVFVGTIVAIGTGVFAVIGQTVVPGVNDLGAQLLGSIVHHGISA